MESAREKKASYQFMPRYRKGYMEALNGVAVTDSKGRTVDFGEAIHAIALLAVGTHPAPRVYFVGNGGSAAIASHQCADFIKNFEIAAHCFNDGPTLTCFSNDYSYEEAFERLVKIFAAKKDIVFLISSSGKSSNIIRAARAAHERAATVVTLSGFEAGNPLRALGAYNFYVPSHSYRYVESAHLHILDHLVDYGIELRARGESRSA